MLFTKEKCNKYEITLSSYIIGYTFLSKKEEKGVIFVEGKLGGIQ